MFLGVELRRIAGEAVQADVFGNPEFLGSVGTGSIHDHDDEFIRMGLADLYEELVHLLRIHLWTDLPVQFPLHRTDRPIDVGELPFVAVVDLRTRRRR